MCQDPQDGLERDLEFFSKTGTGNETWIEAYDPQIKQESLLYNSPSSTSPQKQDMHSYMNSIVAGFKQCNLQNALNSDKIAKLTVSSPKANTLIW